MEEEVLNSASQEVAPQETNDNHADARVEAPVKQETVEDPQDRNWRAFRERQKELERDLKMQRELNEKLLAMNQIAQPKALAEVDELADIGEDEYIPKSKSKKLVQRELDPLRREIEDLKEQLKQQKQVDEINGLKRRFSDFDEVVNSETMALLEQQDPELANTIVQLKDPYKIGVQTYKYIKAMNLQAKIPEARRAKEVDQKLEKNAKTIPSPMANEKRPMAQAFRLTETEKTQLQEEMMRYASMASSVPELS